MKSEPETFGIDDLLRRPNKTDHWEGVRNYQARNMLRDQIQKGDLAFLYHSNCKVPGIVGIMSIVRSGYPDHFAFDSTHRYYDPKSSPENPRWYMVDVKHKRKLKRIISLAELRGFTDGPLKNCPLLRPGNRLSVLPLSKTEWDFILSLE